jgi:hypothetical protein
VAGEFREILFDVVGYDRSAKIIFKIHDDIGNSYSGFYFIRQFKIYYTDSYNNKYDNKEIKNTYNRDWLIAVIDSTFNEDNTISIYSKYYSNIVMNVIEKNLILNTYSGFAYNTKK